MARNRIACYSRRMRAQQKDIDVDTRQEIGHIQRAQKSLTGCLAIEC